MIKLTNILPESNSKVRGLHLITSLFFLALFAFPLFPFKLSNGILMVVSALTITAYLIKPFPLRKMVLKNLVFVIPFIPYLIEFFIYGLEPAVHFEFEKKIFFFTAPFIIPLFINVTGFRNYKLPLLIFSLSVCILTIYSFFGLLFENILFEHSTFKNGAFILRDSFEKISGLHPTYYSIFALTAACFLCLSSVSEKRTFRITYLILATILFLAVLILAVRVAFITGMVFILIWILRSHLSNLRKIVIGLSALTTLIMIFITLPSLNNRLNEFVKWNPERVDNTNTVSQRAVILNCSLQVFSDNILWGCGCRNFQKQLNTCYVSENWPQGSAQEFNPHNQYLSLGINYGIFILLIFVGCLYMICRKIFRLNEGVYFCIAVLLFFMSEAMLERQMGVYFFGLIALLLYNVNTLKKEFHSN